MVLEAEQARRRAFALAEVAGGEGRHAGRRQRRSPSGRRPTGCPAASGRAGRAGRSAAPRPRACPRRAASATPEQRQAEQAAERKQARVRRSESAAARPCPPRRPPARPRERRARHRAAPSWRSRSSESPKRRAGREAGRARPRGSNALARAGRARRARHARGIFAAGHVEHAVLRQVVADELAHDLRRRAGPAQRTAARRRPSWPDRSAASGGRS